MTKFLQLLVGVSIALFVATCTEVRYDHPLDPEGINASDLKKFPLGTPFEDEDGDGTINYNDGNWSLKPRDLNPPVITVKGEQTIEIQLEDTEGKLSRYTDGTNSKVVTAVDPEGSTVRIEVTHNVNKYQINKPSEPYTITYVATDAEGNDTFAVRYVNVVQNPTTDTIPPVLQIGEARVYIALNQVYTDQYSAWDAGDDIDINVVVTGKVDASKSGEYTLTYTATDSKGNKTTATRVVVVEGNPDFDITIPVITLLPPDTFTLQKDQTIEQFKATWKEPGFTATDDRDGDITRKVVVSPITNVDASKFVIRYNVKDSAGNNAAEKIRIIKTGTGPDISAPVIILTLGDSILKVMVGSTTWTDPGFMVTDFKDGTIPNSKVKVNDSLLMKNLDHEGGPYKVTYSVTNSLGLVGYAERMVQVVESADDFTKPVITLKGRNPDTVVVQSTAYTDPGFTATDNRDGDLTAKVTVTKNIDLKRLGLKNTVTYMVSDAAGNKTTVTRAVHVVSDTNTTDLFVRYLVPSPDPLPTIPETSTKFTTFSVDGDGPDLANSILTEIEFKWINDPNNKQFQFYMKYSADPYHADLAAKTTHTLGSASPSMTITGSKITGLDGKYYVAWNAEKKQLIWVKTDKSFAIVLSR